MDKMLQNSTILAPAKINLYLTVKDRRSDGFHNLESVFLAVDYTDILHFQAINSDNSCEIAMEGQNLSISAENNIIFKALSLFRSKTGFFQGVKVRVEKRIPPGGGLGGGSSNAASTLLAMNKMTGFPLDRSALLEMAAVLGSDVPFFIHETPAARVTGRGEQIEPIPAPQMFFVLVNPGFPSDTAAAFRLLDEHRANPLLYSSSHSSTLASLAPWRLGENSLANDFLPVFPEKEKAVYSEIICALLEQGAQNASLSGSGSTCFGVFNDWQQAKKAAQTLRGEWPFVQECTNYSFLSNVN